MSSFYNIAAHIGNTLIQDPVTKLVGIVGQKLPTVTEQSITKIQAKFKQNIGRVMSYQDAIDAIQKDEGRDAQLQQGDKSGSEFQVKPTNTSKPKAPDKSDSPPEKPELDSLKEFFEEEEYTDLIAQAQAVYDKNPNAYARRIDREVTLQKITPGQRALIAYLIED